MAGFYARMIEHEYTSKDIFNKNFMEDWRKVMTDEERKIIKDLKKCQFKEIFEYYQKVFLYTVVFLFILQMIFFCIYNQFFTVRFCKGDVNQPFVMSFY